MESKCKCSSDDSWMHCSLCRAARVGQSTLARAQTRSVHWPQPQTGITTTGLEDPEIHTSLDEAFTSLYQYLQISTRKCGRYHHSNRPHGNGSSDHTHYLRYHTPNFRPIPSVTNPLCRSCDVNVETLPGSYVVTAVREGCVAKTGTRRGKEIVHRVNLEQGKAVSLTIDL